jgi:hypothetical protein
MKQKGNMAKSKDDKIITLSKKGVGAPVEWTPDRKEKAIETIFTEMAQGKSLRQILDHNDTLPSRRLFYEWMAKDSVLSNHYEAISLLRADIMFDEMIEIADDGTRDYMTKEIGDGIEVQVLNTEHIQRSRLRIDARKWILSKMVPKKFGDKTDITTNGKELPSTPIAPSTINVVIEGSPKYIKN